MPARGCVLVAETARNVVTLRAEQKAEFARRVAAMAGLLGAALVGGDRELSADTFAIGTEMTPMRAAAAAAGAAGSGGAGWTSTTMFCAGPSAFLAASHGRSAASASASAAPSMVPTASGIAGPRGRWAKGVPFASLAHAPLPHPAVAPLAFAAAAVGHAGGRSDDAAAAAAGALMRDAAAAAAARLRHAVASAIPAHDPRGGDCPAPESLVFALLPGGGAAAAVRAAFAVPAAAPADAAAAVAGAAGTVKP